MLSVVLITLNEADNLPTLFAALEGVEDVVVVDGGSRDGTVETARQWGARVFERPFDNFAAQRNFALDQAHNDWVLSIDADERPSPGLLDEARRLTADARCVAHRVRIRSSIFGRPFRFSGTQHDLPIRLFRRSAARWRGNVHETLEVQGPTGRLRRELTHTTIPNLHAFFAKMNRYTSLEAQARVVAGRAPRLRDRWLAPPVEVFRRLFWKHGWLDGREGWAFCLLSGLSQWVLADKHRRWWQATHA